MKKTASLILGLLILAGSLAGQEIIFESYPEGVDFWVLIPYNTFMFRKNADSVQYQLSIEIQNQKTKKAENHQSVLNVLKRDWLQNTALPVVFRSELQPGKYQALLRLKNLALGDKYDLKKTFTLGEQYTEIGQPYLLVSKENTQYIPADLGQLPLPVEACEIRQKFSVAVDSVQVACGDSILSFVDPLREIRADLSQMIGNQEDGNPVISFFADNIRYHMDPFLYNQWFSYNTKYSYADQIQQLRYIANQNEWNSIRAVPEEMYSEVIDRFWQVHDPSPGTIRNEAREAFYQKVLIADDRYTIHKRLQGWKSDRGRIYIKYGEPDEVHSEVHPLDLYPYIIWMYYDEGLEFEFADTGGFGQYRLRNKDEEY